MTVQHSLHPTWKFHYPMDLIEEQIFTDLVGFGADRKAPLDIAKMETETSAPETPLVNAYFATVLSATKHQHDEGAAPKPDVNFSTFCAELQKGADATSLSYIIVHGMKSLHRMDYQWYEVNPKTKKEYDAVYQASKHAESVETTNGLEAAELKKSYDDVIQCPHGFDFYLRKEIAFLGFYNNLQQSIQNPETLIDLTADVVSTICSSAPQHATVAHAKPN